MVAVVLFHAEVPGVGGGFVGVDVFFVISGFLITGLLWREVSTTGTVRLRRFYGARARRLLPASATVGVVTMIASAVLLPPLQARSVIGDGIASALYVGNYWFIAQDVDYFGGHLPPSPFQHYWSLGVEEQFYLVWPALIIGTAWLVRRARVGAPAAACRLRRSARIWWSLRWSRPCRSRCRWWSLYVVPPVAFFSLPTRAWELAVGGLVALTAGQWRRLPALAAAIAGWAGLAVILLACTRLGPTTPYPGTAALLPVLGAALVIGAGCAAPAQGVRPRPGIVADAGDRPGVVLVVSVALAGAGARTAIAGPPARAGRQAGSGPASPAGWRCSHCVSSRTRCDSPLPCAGRPAAVSRSAVPPPRSRSVWAWRCWYGCLPRSAAAPAAPALTVTAAPAPTGSDMDAYDAAVQHAFAQVQAAVAASAELKAVPSNLDPPLADAAAELKWPCCSERLHAHIYQVGQPECATGDTASTTTVALVGDSHAAMWNPAFQQVAAQRHWRLETLAKAACPLMDLPIANNLTSPGSTLRSASSGALRSSPGYAPSTRGWSCSACRGSTVPAAGSRFHVIRPGVDRQPDPPGAAAARHRRAGAGARADPGSALMVPDCLSGHLDDATACSPPRSTAVNQPGIAAESAATKAGGGQYADLTELFCTADRCPVIVGNTLVYFDENHLTLEYSRLLAPVIGALADRALA